MVSSANSQQAPGFLIGPADSTQGPAMQALIVRVLQEYGLTPDPSGTDADVLDIEQHYRQSGGEFFAVWHGDQLVGTMGIVPVNADSCELRKMYLLPEVRGFGLGRRLLLLAEQETRRRGYHWLQLETASALTEAVALYERHGYRSQCGAPHVSRCDRLYRKELPS